MPRETTLENKVVVAVEAAGGYCIKLVPFRVVGLPDRLVVLPGGVVWFVELKAARGSNVRPAQKIWDRRLKKLGMNYLRTHDFKEFERVILDRQSAA